MSENCDHNCSALWGNLRGQKGKCQRKGEATQAEQYKKKSSPW